MKTFQTLYPKPQGLGGYLERMPQLRSGLSQVRASQQSTQLLLQCMPAQIKDALHAIRLMGSTVFISVTSNEAAAWVRLRRPEIERAITDKGLKFNEILVTVQSRAPEKSLVRPSPTPAVATQLSGRAMSIRSERMQTSMERLAKTLANRAKR